MANRIARNHADTAAPPAAELDTFERRLLNDFQCDFPLTSRPFADLARRLGSDEATVLDTLSRLHVQGFISRIGAVVAPHRTGWSTLAAMAVPADRLEEVAALVSGYREVNHNYEREHGFNLWFVVNGPDQDHVEQILSEIESAAGLDVMSLPLVEAFRIDLGFPLQWH